MAGQPQGRADHLFRRVTAPANTASTSDAQAQVSAIIHSIQSAQTTLAATPSECSAHQAKVAMSNVSDLLNVPSRPIKQKIRLKVGRKSAYTKEIAERFCAKIASGHSMSDICGKDGMPTSRQVFDWIHKYPEFGASYDRATIERGMHFGHKLTDLAAGVLAGEIDPQAARVAGDFYKFTAARLASKTWGEKSQVTVEHSVSAQAAQVLQELALRGKARQIEAQCIDVTPVPSLDEGVSSQQDQLLTIDCTDLAPIGAVDEAGPRPPAPATTPAPGCSSSTPASHKRRRK